MYEVWTLCSVPVLRGQVSSLSVWQSGSPCTPTWCASHLDWPLMVCCTPGLALNGVLHTRLALSDMLHTRLALDGVYCSSSHTLPSSLLPVALGRMCCETQQMDHLLIKTILSSLQIDGEQQ